MKRGRIKKLTPCGKAKSGFNQVDNFLKEKINVKRYSTGFTLIELMFAIVFIGIFVAVVIPQLYQLKSQLGVTRAAYRFAQDLRKMQDRSISSVQYRDAAGDLLAVDGYGAYINLESPGNAQYILYADASPGNQQYDIGDHILETVDISSIERGVVINSIQNGGGPDVSINFKPPRPDTTITPNQSSVEVVFSPGSSSSETKSVFINTTGFIEVQ